MTLFAGEPDVKQPIAMAIDDRGRLWVAEAYAYPSRAPEGKGRDRILIFEDTDGDGQFDKRKVFAEKLNLVSGLEVGFGGVWVGAAPVPAVHSRSRTATTCPTASRRCCSTAGATRTRTKRSTRSSGGPTAGSTAATACSRTRNVGKPGTPDDERMPINAGIWRYHPTRHEFEVFADGTSNPVGRRFRRPRPGVSARPASFRTCFT